MQVGSTLVVPTFQNAQIGHTDHVTNNGSGEEPGPVRGQAQPPLKSTSETQCRIDAIMARLRAKRAKEKPAT